MNLVRGRRRATGALLVGALAALVAVGAAVYAPVAHHFRRDAASGDELGATKTLRQALLRWLDVRGDGRDIVRLDETRYAYVEVEDAHLRARSARWEGERCIVFWDDDLDEELDYASLRQAPDHALYARVHQRLRGRIAGPAYHAIAARVVERSGAFELEAAGRRWPIEMNG